jgi:hypothetical protein
MPPPNTPDLLVPKIIIMSSLLLEFTESLFDTIMGPLDV